MLRNFKIAALMTTILLFVVASVSANIIRYDEDMDYTRQLRFDRYLDVEVWTDDEEYYEGDQIQISFKANMDCYVAIYNIDTRGRVNLIFPYDPTDNNFIKGEEVYFLPSDYDDYELTVSGPEGIEHIHIVASQRPFDIPDWYNGSNIVCDYDPYDFVDFIDANYFGGDRDMRRAYDLTSFYVDEWNPHYFRPIYVDRPYYHHDYWDWGLYGSVYVDYPFGATIYIDGIYWGVAPLFIPRIYYGHHYITVYDHFGYCWEDRIEIVKTRSIVLNENRIKTLPNVKSRFTEVQKKGYLTPDKNGYPDYSKKVETKKKYESISKTAKIDKDNIVVDNKRQTTGKTGTTYTTKTKSATSPTTKKYQEKSSTYNQSKKESTSKSYESKTGTKTSKSSSTESGKTYRKSSSSKSGNSQSYRNNEKSSTSKSTSKRSTSKKSDKSSSSNSAGKSPTYKKSDGSSSSNSSGSSSSGKSSRSSSGGSYKSSGGSSSGKSTSSSGSKSSSGSSSDKSSNKSYGGKSR